jgi:hypothetical protein
LADFEQKNLIPHDAFPTQGKHARFHTLATFLALVLPRLTGIPLGAQISNQTIGTIKGYGRTDRGAFLDVKDDICIPMPRYAQKTTSIPSFLEILIEKIWLLLYHFFSNN